MFNNFMKSVFVKMSWNWSVINSRLTLISKQIVSLYGHFTVRKWNPLFSLLCFPKRICMCQAPAVFSATLNFLYSDQPLGWLTPHLLLKEHFCQQVPKISTWKEHASQGPWDLWKHLALDTSRPLIDRGNLHMPNLKFSIFRCSY